MWVCITSHCGEFVLNTFLCGEFVYYITLWWVCITSFYGEFVISPFVVSLYCITLCYITVVGLYYITLWWVWIPPFVVSGSSLLWCFYIIYFVVFLYHLLCGDFFFYGTSHSGEILLFPLVIYNLWFWQISNDICLHFIYKYWPFTYYSFW